nr:MAG TPA: hypothetical protein [Caudoviricetes sp.]
MSFLFFMTSLLSIEKERTLRINNIITHNVLSQVIK